MSPWAVMRISSSNIHTLKAMFIFAAKSIAQFFWRTCYDAMGVPKQMPHILTPPQWSDGVKKFATYDDYVLVNLVDVRMELALSLTSLWPLSNPSNHLPTVLALTPSARYTFTKRRSMCRGPFASLCRSSMAHLASDELLCQSLFVKKSQRQYLQ